ncbi:L,D-transpeptidase [Fulvimarina sp. 2208YS6-2-32]|uniref:L,D-transpeptidase n=1 Tax=Fulvimarina uroteuthidis TaxID=3098149 RepID=A0ABU5HWW8_9HYPH|nr:L,D-transpeptidase [Fulvimarina sp. 2208YS6-2-32]MDY8107587.1 L,D-transpeptidase [Fulvimarina sp. 2208YS6-2-32]
MTHSPSPLTRRTLLVGGAAIGLAGCTTPRQQSRNLVPAPLRAEQADLGAPTDPREALRTNELDARYAAVVDDGHSLPAIPYWKMQPRFYRQRVPNPTGEPAGTVIVDTPNRFLYLVEEDGMAMRYGVGIGRDGFEWSGEGIIHWRQHWPRWKVPDEMIARKPSLEIYSVANGGMAPGIDNPLGARALYIFHDGKDTLYRLHGTPEWWTIGGANSSGCVRLVNQDVIDLYERVPYHARIVVHQSPIGQQIAAL